MYHSTTLMQGTRPFALNLDFPLKKGTVRLDDPYPFCALNPQDPIYPKLRELGRPWALKESIFLFRPG